MKYIIIGCALCAAGLTGIIGGASAQSGEAYAIDWFTIDGGSGASGGGGFSLSGTAGQPEASPEPLTGGAFSLGGGFWSLLADTTSSAPQLSIEIQGLMVRVFWPLFATGIELEQSDSLTGTWSRVVSPYVTNTTEISLTAPVSAETRFYRARGLPATPSGMALIPAGTFVMGNSTAAAEGEAAELPPHSVSVDEFYIDKHEVTKALWDEVYQWATAHGYQFDLPAARGKAASHPAQNMTWYDAVKWCNARSEKEGRSPAYYASAERTTVYRTGLVNVPNAGVEWNAGYRLPTEAEWEKASRGGVSGWRFPWGDTIEQTRANYYGLPGTAGNTYDLAPAGYHPTYATGSLPYTSPVGSFAANGYGLYDMAGNVWEWCWDGWSESYYRSSPVNNPRGPATGSDRAIRGGSWVNIAFYCRSADRYDYLPGSRNNNLGFRTVLTPSR